MTTSLLPGKTDHEIAEIAYTSVADVPTLEMNDRNRLGFHIYRYLTGQIDSVAAAVSEARSRLTIGEPEAAAAQFLGEVEGCLEPKTGTSPDVGFCAMSNRLTLPNASLKVAVRSWRLS